MTGKQLKNSILQLAIQGKLVPQDPHDEPASELLKRIRKEKEQLVKTGKLKKKDLESTPIAEDEKPFEIPETWEWVRIKDIFTTTSGSTPLSSNPLYYNGPINWTRTTDLNDSVLRKCEKTITEKAFHECNLKIIPRESICIAMYGGSGTIGKNALIDFDTTINQSVCAIYPNGFCDMRYLQFYMHFFRPNWMDYAAGSRKDPNINKIIINNTLFPLPPLSEQHRIVEKIEELMPLVEEYDKAQSELDKLNESLPEQLKKSILQQAIMGKLVPQDPNDEPASELLKRIRKEKENLVKLGALKKKDLITTPISEEEKSFDIPESWEWVNIPQIGISQLGKTKNPNQRSGFSKPYICSINVYWEGINLDVQKEMLFEDDEVVKYEIRKGDLLVCEGGDCGRAAIWDKDNSSLYQNALHRVRLFGNVCPKYLLYVLYFYKVSGFIDDYIKGETIKHLVKGQLDSIPFPLPPLSEQHRIVAKIEELFNILK